MRGIFIFTIFVDKSIIMKDNKTPYYKYAYGKFIFVGYIEDEKEIKPTPKKIKNGKQKKRAFKK